MTLRDDYSESLAMQLRPPEPDKDPFDVFTDEREAIVVAAIQQVEADAKTLDGDCRGLKR